MTMGSLKPLMIPLSCGKTNSISVSLSYLRHHQQPRMISQMCARSVLSTRSCILGSEKEAEKYVYKDGFLQSIGDDSIHYMEPLLIDYSLLISSSSSPKALEELDKFVSALSSWGCFQLINHGIPTSFLDETKEASRQFFALPVEERLKYSLLPGDTNNGYRDGRVTNLNNQVLDWNEVISLTVYPQDRRKIEFWPEKPPNFKTLMNEYASRLAGIFDTLFKMVIHSLNVDEEKFANQYGKNKEMNVRFNFYPCCPNSNRVVGLKPHADYSAMTLVLHDGEGLQVLKDDQWFMVPVLSDALFLILGDPIEIMSNGIYKSAVHRAVTSREKSRVSVAAFWDNDRNNEIGPLDELITAARPQVYQRVSLKDYSSTFVEHYYQSGKRPIEAVRICN